MCDLDLQEKIEINKDEIMNVGKPKRETKVNASLRESTLKLKM